jgi:transposase
MSIQRRKFSKEFKIQIIREIDNGIPVAQLSRQHQIHESLIHKWRKQFQKDPVNAFRCILQWKWYTINTGSKNGTA